MDFRDFRFLVNKLMEDYLPYKEGIDIKERWAPIINRFKDKEVSISLFNHTLMLIKFYANKVVLWDIEEIEFAYKLVFDYIDLCISESPNFIFNRFRAYTRAPKRLGAHRNRVYCETALKMRDVLSRD